MKISQYGSTKKKKPKMNLHDVTGHNNFFSVLEHVTCCDLHLFMEMDARLEKVTFIAAPSKGNQRNCR
jgi:hypothetical protein